MSGLSNDNDFIRRTSPSYARVREWLLKYIEDYKLSPGAKIPADRALANVLGLSRPTIARAVSILVEEGVLVREERNGTFVGGQIPRQPVFSRCYTIGVFTPWIAEEPTGEITGSRNVGWQDEQTKGDIMSLQIIHGVISVSNAQGHRLQIRATRSSEEESACLSLLEDRAVDGALVIPLHSRLIPRYEGIAFSGPPMVFVDRYIRGVNVDWVATDNFIGTKQAVLHLIEKGHRRIAFFTDFTELTSVVDREAGYRAALEERGIAFDEDLVCGMQSLRHGAWSFDHALEHCVNLADPVTAVFCMNDDVVWAAVQAANRLSLSVPDQIEISGFFDDRIPSGINAPFSRVVQSTFEMGRVSAQMLLERITGEAPPEPRHVLLPARLLLSTSE